MLKSSLVPRYRVTVGSNPADVFEMEVRLREDGPVARGHAAAAGKQFAEDRGLGDVSIRVELIGERLAS
ncbi:MAG: hypothetical protein F4081_02445 [Dehalococcoidia bacterium]|nr:hypothetical protein [Dehalococcoidia bacterium]